jgi:DNA gyrase subunit B
VREYQAVLPIRGKILNTYVNANGRGNSNTDYATKALSKMMSSSEIVTLINALGTGSKDFNIENLRYDKIVIMTDADVDGSHIRTLLLTFFNNFPFNQLIENGHLYLAQPPLFKVTKGTKSVYIKDENSLEEYILKISDKLDKKIKKNSKAYDDFMKEQREKLSIQRFKGLGEMNPEELWQTTLNPENRTMLRVQYSKGTKEKSKEDQKMIQILMGDDVAPRKDFITSNALDVANLDI